MNLRASLAGFILAASALSSNAAPVLQLGAVGGVDLNNLTLGQVFQLEVVVQGDVVGEVDAGGSGAGTFSSYGWPYLSLTNIVIGTLGGGVDWTLSPTLFVIDFRADSLGSGFVSTSGQCLISTVQNYGCGFSSGPLSFVVREAAVQVPEPGSLALLGLGLVGLAAARKRKQA